MKKVTAIILVLVLVFSLAGCGKGGITIEDLEKGALQDVKTGAAFTVTEAGSGWNFSYRFDVVLADGEIYGTADAGKNITSVSYKLTGGKMDYFQSMTAHDFVEHMNDVNNVVMGKLCYDFMLFQFANVAAQLDGNTDAENVFAMADVLMAARRSSQSQNGWTYSVEFRESADEVILTATREN